MQANKEVLKRSNETITNVWCIIYEAHIIGASMAEGFDKFQCREKMISLAGTMGPNNFKMANLRGLTLSRFKLGKAMKYVPEV